MFTSGRIMSSMFNWLHLTDLHFGLAGQQPLWPNVRDKFFEDLASLRERTGPWDAVLFTGDFVQRGAKPEFQKLDEEVLGPLWDELQRLGSGDAVLLAVPGNHDLVRPLDPNDKRKPTPAERCLLNPDWFADVSDEFWQEPQSLYREVVDKAFANFVKWRNGCRLPQPPGMRDGLLPGDFATTLTTADGRHVGVLGLNTTFLQLAGGDYQGKLAWDLRQFHAACGGDGPGWVAEHDVCLLLTHQGPEWLDTHSRDEVYSEINPAGRFAVHLFGHMHENVIRSTSTGGGKPLRQWQGNSLFSLEPWGEPPKFERRHGYAIGRIEFDGDAATIRHWPRKTVKDTNGVRPVPDHESCVLLNDEGTEPESIPLQPRKSAAAPAVTSDGLTRRQTQLVDAYRRAALAQVDIVDLANLPEDDRHIAMQRFVLRQLYIPLRMTVDAPTRDELDEATLIKWEQQREQTRLIAAGRAEDKAGDDKISKRSLGELLTGVPEFDAQPARLVILGDPGGGKTTLLRWLATAWLLRAERPEDAAALPDAASLPDGEWLPILVRCRQLDRDRLGECTLADILLQTLRPMELKLPEADVAALVEALVEQLDAGRAALLIDGLDEIADPQLRSRFCERLETIARQYDRVPLLATSRIVGYREMPRRLGRGFRHATLAELSPADKDDFVRRWCDTVERDPARRRDEAAKLLAGIHDESRRIERLTGNPMLLTTMALVQRKVGRLPARRHKLYEEAVGVLLNWRSDVERPLDAEEAWPQLEYVAWAMCDRGVQRLRRDQVLSLLEAVRREYPHIRPVTRRTPEEFLKLVESRTSLLVEVGTERHDGLETPVYEFRHLTIQEYLAAVALIRGHFPGHDPKKTLAERVGPLAGRIEAKAKGREPEVTENWREALRLCVAACNDDDVDSALQAILGVEHVSNVLESGGDGHVGNVPHDQLRPRAILAALCLADEPNASQTVAEEVFRRFAEVVGENDGNGFASTGLDRAALEVATSAWSEPLELALAAEFLRRSPKNRWNPGGLSGMVSVRRATALQPVTDTDEAASNAHRAAWMQTQADRLRSPNDTTAVVAALAVMTAAFEQNARLVPGLTDALLALTARSPAVGHATCLAMFFLTGGWDKEQRVIWQPAAELEQLVRLLPPGPTNASLLLPTSPPLTDFAALGWLARIAGNIHSPAFVPGLLALLTHKTAKTRSAAAEALGNIADPRAVEPLIGLLSDETAKTRRAALKALARIRNDETDAKLLTEDFNVQWSWLDPLAPIDEARVQKAAAKLKLPVAEIRRRYQTLAEEYRLKLDFPPEP